MKLKDQPLTRKEVAEAFETLLVLLQSRPFLDTNLLNASRATIRHALLGEAIPTAPVRV